MVKIIIIAFTVFKWVETHLSYILSLAINTPANSAIYANVLHAHSKIM